MISLILLKWVVRVLFLINSRNTYVYIFKQTIRTNRIFVFWNGTGWIYLDIRYSRDIEGIHLPQQPRAVQPLQIEIT